MEACAPLRTLIGLPTADFVLGGIGWSRFDGANADCVLGVISSPDPAVVRVAIVVGAALSPACPLVGARALAIERATWRGDGVGAPGRTRGSWDWRVVVEDVISVYVALRSGGFDVDWGRTRACGVAVAPFVRRIVVVGAFSLLSMAVGLAGTGRGERMGD